MRTARNYYTERQYGIRRFEIVDKNDATGEHNTVTFETKEIQKLKFNTLQCFCNEIEVNLCHKIAAFLCPSFNKLLLVSDFERKETHQAIRQMMADITASEPEVIVISDDEMETEDAGCSAEKRGKSSKCLFRDWRDEFRHYLTTQHDFDEDNGDLLSWWSMNATCYPKIAKIAREFLCIPASSIISEEIFHTVQSLASEKMCETNSVYLSDLLMVHKNCNL